MGTRRRPLLSADGSRQTYRPLSARRAWPWPAKGQDEDGTHPAQSPFQPQPGRLHAQTCAGRFRLASRCWGAEPPGQLANGTDGVISGYARMANVERLPCKCNASTALVNSQSQIDAWSAPKLGPCLGFV